MGHDIPQPPPAEARPRAPRAPRARQTAAALLADLVGQPELQYSLALYREAVLGALVAHDAARGSDLVRTLRVYLACHGNVTRAAAVLFLHRNSLLYRLDRIRQILACDLDDAHERLALALALFVEESSTRPP